MSTEDIAESVNVASSGARIYVPGIIQIPKASLLLTPSGNSRDARHGPKKRSRDRWSHPHNNAVTSCEKQSALSRLRSAESHYPTHPSAPYVTPYSVPHNLSGQINIQPYRCITAPSTRLSTLSRSQISGGCCCTLIASLKRAGDPFSHVCHPLGYGRLSRRGAARKKT